MADVSIPWGNLNPASFRFWFEAALSGFVAGCTLVAIAAAVVALSLSVQIWWLL